MELVQHLMSREAVDGMTPVRSQLHHGTQEEVSLGQMPMRHLQCGGVDDQVINGDDVNVHQAVDVASVDIAVRRTSQAAFNVMDAVQHLHRFKVTG